MPAMQSSQGLARIQALDVLRGAALAGMFIFHTIWDLGFFGLIPLRVPVSPWFMAFGHLVAATFLSLSGASLVLALPDGRPGRGYWRRLALIAAAAAVITGATYWLMPDAYIFFGILHCIALGSLVGLAFLRAPWQLTALVAAIVLLAPWFAVSPALDSPFLWWLGLGPTLPRTNDWRPVFPWLGFVLAGVAVMRLAVAIGWARQWEAWRSHSWAGRLLTWGGRHSLLVYLVHQPIFLGAIWLIAQVATPSLPQVEADPFATSCVSQCVGTGADAPVCRRVCGCISSEIRKDAARWQRLLDNSLTPLDRAAIDSRTELCVRQTEAP